MRDALGDVESVLVLGGRSEIAMATVRALVARRTRRVVLAVRDPDTVIAELSELRAAGATEVRAVAFDATHFDTHDDLIAGIWRDEGDIDVVLLAFGVLGDQTESEHSGAVARSIVDTTFTGAVSVLVAVANRMEQQGHGSIVVVSSVAAVRPRRANFTYAAAKAGLDAYTQGLADRLHGTGVHVMVVRPGFVHTRMTAGMAAAPFSTDPDTVATAIVEGVRKQSHTVYAPSILRAVMPVLRALPRPIWRRLRA